MRGGKIRALGHRDGEAAKDRADRFGLAGGGTGNVRLRRRRNSIGKIRPERDFGRREEWRKCRSVGDGFPAEAQEAWREMPEADLLATTLLDFLDGFPLPIPTAVDGIALELSGDADVRDIVDSEEFDRVGDSQGDERVQDVFGHLLFFPSRKISGEEGGSRIVEPSKPAIPISAVPARAGNSVVGWNPKDENGRLSPTNTAETVRDQGKITDRAGISATGDERRREIAQSPMRGSIRISYFFIRFQTVTRDTPRMRAVSERFSPVARRASISSRRLRSSAAMPGPLIERTGSAVSGTKGRSSSLCSFPFRAMDPQYEKTPDYADRTRLNRPYQVKGERGT